MQKQKQQQQQQVSPSFPFRFFLFFLSLQSLTSSVSSQRTCAETATCFNCAVQDLAGATPFGCAWCQTRGDPAKGTCAGSDSLSCPLDSSFRIDAGEPNLRLQELCAYQIISCSSCLTAGGTWGQLVKKGQEPKDADTVARCFPSQESCTREKVLLDPFTNDAIYNLDSSICVDSCDDDGLTYKAILGDPLPEPILATSPTDDPCALKKDCLSCGSDDGNNDNDCRWCAAEYDFHEGACIGTDKGVGTADTNYCPERSAMFDSGSTHCALQAPTCDTCMAGGGVWGVYYGVTTLPDGSPLVTRYFRRCFPTTHACQATIDLSDVLPEGGPLAPPPRRCEKTDCSTFNAVDQIGTNNFRLDDDNAAHHTVMTTVAAAIAVVTAAVLAF